MYSLSLIRRNLSNAGIDNQGLTFLMIGDGYGVLSSLVKAIFPESTLVMVDIGKTLLFQAYYCQMAHPAGVHRMVGSTDDIGDADFVYCPTEKLDMLSNSKFDVAVNIASMQEMTNATVDRYFRFLRSNLNPNNLLYCLNRDSKTLIGGEITEFLQYPWQKGDRNLLDEDCPWYRYYFSRGAPGIGKYIFGVRLPFVNLFDGTHHHRLSIMETD